jgi:hypothetical protein
MGRIELVCAHFKELCYDSSLRKLNGETCLALSTKSEKQYNSYASERLLYMKLSAYFGAEEGLNTLIKWYQNSEEGFNSPVSRYRLQSFLINLARRGSEDALTVLKNWTEQSYVSNDFFLYDVSIKEQFIESLQYLGS